MHHSLSSLSLATDVRSLLSELDELKERVRELEYEKRSMFDSQEKRADLVKEIAKRENQSFYDECLTCIHEGKFSRKLDHLLLLPEDKVSSQPFNPVVAAFVDELMKHDSGQPGSSILRQEAVECLRGARHGKFVSEFHIGLQAIAYALSGSRLVVDLMGHVGPGCEYIMLKAWLDDLGGLPLKMPRV